MGVALRLEHVDGTMGRIALRIKTRQIDQRHQHSQIERAVHHEDVLGGQLEPLTDEGQQFRGNASVDLEPNDVASTAAAKFSLDQLQLRSAALVVQFQFRITGEPDECTLFDRLSRKELRKMLSDHFFEQHKIESS